MRFYLRPLNLNINVHVAVNVITKVNIAHMKIKRKCAKQNDKNHNKTNNKKIEANSNSQKLKGNSVAQQNVQKAIKNEHYNNNSNTMAIVPSTATTTTTTNDGSKKKKCNNKQRNDVAKMPNKTHSVDGMKMNSADNNKHRLDVALLPANNTNKNTYKNTNKIGKMICESNVKPRPRRASPQVAVDDLLALERMPLLLLINTLGILLLAFCCQHVHCSAADLATPRIFYVDDFIAAAAMTTTTTATPPIPIASAAMLGNFTLDLITDACKRRCEAEKNLFQDEFGIKCDRDDDSSEKCYKQRCNKGCELWWHALQEFESCQEACSASVFYPYDMPCISACEIGQHLHAYLQRLALTPLVAAIKPQLLTTPPTTTTDGMATHHAGEPDQQQADGVAADASDSEAEVIVVAATAEAVDVGSVGAAGADDGAVTDNGAGEGRDVDGSLMGNSLRLKWSITLPDNYFASRPFNIQYQLADSATDSAPNMNLADDQQWQYLADYNCNAEFDCKILDGLMPYTSYRFRFELVFGEAADEVLHSPASDVYHTPASGTPISAPNITDAFAMDQQHIAVFWSNGQFTNGPLKGYKLLLTADDMSNKTIEEFVPDQRQQHVFSDLKANTRYTLHIAMVNAEGDGPNATLSVRTKEALAKSHAPLEELQNVLLANEHNIKLLNLETYEAQTLHESVIPLNDFAYHSALRRLYFTDATGALKSLQVNNNASEITLITLDKSKLDFQPNKVTLDWLNQRLYMAGTSGQGNSSWSLASCDLQGSDVRQLGVLSNETVLQLDVDPLNGWLFYTTGAMGDKASRRVANQLWRLNLADASQLLVLNASQIGYFINDYQRFMLLVYHRSGDGELHEHTYDGLHRRRVPSNVSRLLRGNDVDGGGEAVDGDGDGDVDATGLQSFSYHGGVLLATNGTQLIYEHQRSGDSELWPLDGATERCRRFWLPQQQASQPQPRPPSAAPAQLQALLSAHVAHISWAAPPRNAYQAPRAWARWEYELEILDVASSSAFNIRNVRTPFFHVERLQADNLYQLRVRVTAGGGGAEGASIASASAWTAPLHVRTWPLGEHKLWWAGRDADVDADSDVLYETNELGVEGQRVAALPAGVRSVVQLNGTLLFVTARRGAELADRLRCANVLAPELNCSLGAATALSVAYDWRAGKVYWADGLRDCVLRADYPPPSPPSESTTAAAAAAHELLPIFGAQQLAVDSERGLLYYSTGRRLLRRALSGVHEADEAEYYHVNGLGGHIRAFALALEQQRLYWIVRQAGGSVRLFAANAEASPTGVPPPPLVDRLLAADVADASLTHLGAADSLLWLQRRSSRAVLLRTDALGERAALENTALRRATVVQLRTDYAPPRDPAVRPPAVAAEGVHIGAGGYWDDFQLRWAPVALPAGGDNHTVFYKVLLQHAGQLLAAETLAPQLRVTAFHQPQLLLDVAVTAHTRWAAGATTRVQLRTPAAAPAQPKRLRIFVERVPTPLQRADELQRASALIRWEPPENTSASAPVAYRVYCWRGDELFAELLHEHGGAGRALEAHVPLLRLGETYTFQVQAFAGGRAAGGERTAFHALHVEPAQQAVPRLLYATAEHVAELDLDRQGVRVLVRTGSEADQLAVVRGEQRLLWVNENVELMSYVPTEEAQGASTATATPVKLARMRAEVLALSVDWVTRTVYWAEAATDAPQAVALYRLELCGFEGRVMLGTRLYTTAARRRLRDLVVLPYAQQLLWLEASVDERGATLMARNLTADAATPAAPLRTDDALARMFEGALGGGDAGAEAETVLLLDQRGKLCVYDVRRQHCQPLRLPLGVPAAQLQDVQRDTSFYYALHNSTVYAYSRRTLQLAYSQVVWGVRRIRAYNAQPYPPRDCLLPAEGQVLAPQLTLVEQRYVLLSLPPLRRVGGAAACWLPLAGLRYRLAVTDEAHNHTRHFSAAGVSVLNITALEPFSNYTLELSASAYYQQKLGQPALSSAPLAVRTAVGVPTQPRNFSAHTLSPTEIEVAWRPPRQLNCARVWYELHWQAANSTGGAHKALDSATNYTLGGLTPGQHYDVWLKALCTPDKYNTTASVGAATFAAPEPLELLERGAYNLSLTWQPSGPLVQAVLVCQAANGDTYEQYTLDVDELAAVNISAALIVVSNLVPRTRYEFHMQLRYANVSRPYEWPEFPQERIVFDTLGDRPSAPGQPHIEHITGEIFKVYWEPARNNGAPILEYRLEGLQQHIVKRMRRGAVATTDNRTLGHLLSQLAWVEEPKPIEDEWIMACNTTELSCIVRDVHTQRLLMFRVRARNEPYGWGPYSPDSEHVSEPYVSAEKRDSLIFAIIAPAAIVSSFVIVLVVIRVVHQRRLRAKKLLEQSRPSIWSNLSTQQQQQLVLARHRAFSLVSNSTAYGMSPLSDADIALLPHINWSQITLVNFLGSGAFGEVYEGCVKWDDDETPEKVAIKCLRKGANEFSELLQEAQLMSNFQHENIVRLIGVCFETEAISIIMEHMEGGDLLTYLRESRPILSRAQSTLQLLDLLTMCIDVATGCAYLEDMHFVHRDLACRNCLVSARDPAKRVVKIGDFGLARDIYKNDYYRKEGEGLLPVRWMSPESLVDGVFTTQSDVWAFGVLCWEIFTLGQQPYAARNNFEVLTYVKDAGRLEQPENCPDKLFELWLECWQDDPEQRPTFRKCRNVLLSIKTDVRRISLSPHVNEMDGGDYHIYANHNNVVLTSFLANPLPKVTEEDEDDVDTVKGPVVVNGKVNSKASPSSSVCSASSLNKPDFKVHFEISDAKDCDLDNASDNSQLITHIRRLGSKKNKDQRSKNEPQYYVNEGISRL